MKIEILKTNLLLLIVLINNPSLAQNATTVDMQVESANDFLITSHVNESQMKDILPVLSAENNLLTVLTPQILIPVKNPILGETKGCDKGWTSFKNEKCYKLIPKLLATAAEASLLCSVEFGDKSPNVSVLTIESYKEQEFLRTFILEDLKLTQGIWLAAVRVNNTNIPKWVTNMSDLKFPIGHKHQPFEDNKQCVELNSRYFKRTYPSKLDMTWSFVSCHKRANVICQKSPDILNDSNTILANDYSTSQEEVQNSLDENIENDVAFLDGLNNFNRKVNQKDSRASVDNIE